MSKEDELNAPKKEVLSKLIKTIDLERLFPQGLDYIYLPRVDSTNKYAREHTDIENAIIVAKEQYAGVGKNGAKWLSDSKGSLITTFVFSIEPDMDVASMLPLFIGASIHEVLKNYGIDSYIKWPNDIYIDGKKLLGILCGSVIDNGRIKKLIIGIGINVNQTSGELLADNSISLRSHTGRYFNKRELLNDTLISILNRINNPDQVKKFSTTTVNSNLYLKNENISFSSDRLYRGRLMGINDKGEIVILTDDGQKAFSSGKILI